MIDGSVLIVPPGYNNERAIDSDEVIKLGSNDDELLHFKPVIDDEYTIGIGKGTVLCSYEWCLDVFI